MKKYLFGLGTMLVGGVTAFCPHLVNIMVNIIKNGLQPKQAKLQTSGK